jgi:hypothetical protein
MQLRTARIVTAGSLLFSGLAHSQTMSMLQASSSSNPAATSAAAAAATKWPTVDGTVV